jgi:hypothetical protein
VDDFPQLGGELLITEFLGRRKRDAGPLKLSKVSRFLGLLVGKDVLPKLLGNLRRGIGFS